MASGNVLGNGQADSVSPVSRERAEMGTIGGGLEATEGGLRLSAVIPPAAMIPSICGEQVRLNLATFLGALAMRLPR